MGTIRFDTSFLDPDELPDDVRGLEVGQAARVKSGMVLRTPQGQYRLQELAVDIKDPAKAARPSPVLLVDQSKTTTGQVVTVLTADGKLRLNTVLEKNNLLTGQTTYKLSGIDLPYAEYASTDPPLKLFMSALGDQIYLFWKDGRLVRIDARDKAKPMLAEVRDVLENGSLQVTEVRCLLGKGTFLVGDSSGRVRAWFYVPAEEAGRVVCAHDFPGTGAAVTALAVSDRSRSAAVAHRDGKIRLLFVTSDRVMAELDVSGQIPKSLVLAPKDDGLAAAAAGGIWQWTIDPLHPEITFKSLFSKVWYETHEKPEFVWQSTGGTDSFEPKYSLVPLIIGTLKASFYSLLFGVPLALLAAIYTSEFMHPKSKAVVKPTIELMASLPSVVLGFLAGLVFAQFVERIVPTVLASLFTVPLAFLVGAYFWQLLPDRLAQVLARGRFLFICLVMPPGLLAAIPVGALMEQVLFDGDLRRWLDGGGGSAVGGWVLVLLPLSAIVSVLLMGRYVNPWVRRQTIGLNRLKTALVDFGKFQSACAGTVLLAWVVALILDGFGFDARGLFLGPYSQRNALVVGFIMGFAIIPIIYTIAEDALSSVPEHLRAGSLATGATRWQTAIRIIIPTAMSGLFSAVMIGLGRAVGETMIVLMATGNTPVMNWSIFSGFRTLSANIAVELPDAVRNSTHYRTLFLAALTLFAITFVLNSLAELVRLRFRRRAYQL
ncbi:MAG: ABC transporter permease subunit [Planctomycetes bacterium]|nr:ABC transporter permease subunit [Planctomycetota bacterium]